MVQEAKRLYSSYHGAEIQVFNAIMKAAVQCDQYKLGKDIYKRLCSLDINKTAPSFATALKIHSRLGSKTAVREIWAEAVNTCELDPALAAARISAAAAEGDLETAAAVLDQMNDTGIAIDVSHISSAIRACWQAEGNHTNAAKYLFQLLKALDLKPNIVTFASLVGAYANAELEDILAAYAEMKMLGILPNKVFAETYLVTVLRVRKPKQGRLTDQKTIAELRKCSPERIAAASQAIADFEGAGISLTSLSMRIRRAMTKL